MGDAALRSVLEQLEERGRAGLELVVSLALLAGEGVSIGEAELAAARRRALFVLAAGGDPHRELDLEGRPVTALADDLDRPERHGELAASLAALHAEARDLPVVTEAIESLIRDRKLAWRAYACALLAEELADQD